MEHYLSLTINREILTLKRMIISKIQVITLELLITINIKMRLIKHTKMMKLIRKLVNLRKYIK